MSLVINHNITALNAWRNLTVTDRKMSKTMERLSSGLRINRAADDPAGLVISERMRAQLAGLTSAQRNTEKAINMVGTAEAALDKVNELLLKIRSLVVDTANLGVTDSQMAQANQDELEEAIDSITRIGNYTQFGTKYLLNGDVSTGVKFQIGANKNQTITVSIEDMRASALATGASITSTTILAASGVSNHGLYVLKHSDVLTAAVSNANSSGATALAQALIVIDKAIEEVSQQRGKLGAIVADNLEVNLDRVRVAYENLQAAESTIRDADMTYEMAEFTKYQIMMQAGTAMLAQANQIPNNILQLLR